MAITDCQEANQRQGKEEEDQETDEGNESSMFLLLGTEAGVVVGDREGR